jgi:hypothetical protein
VGLKGTMNALFLKDLADKTRRGLRGRVEAGKSGGGNSYGYDVVKRTDSAGEAIKGERTINKTEALIVKRIMTEYVSGISPLQIVTVLNKEGVASPSGKGWGQSTINGNQKRGTGILNNELYIGRLVWNRLRYMKDPDTGKRISRLNPPEDLIMQDVPDLRIIDQELWDQVKVRQKKQRQNQKPRTPYRFRDQRRPKYLLSGLLRCGRCHGVYTATSKSYFGCSTRLNKGTCDNHHYIKHDRLEAVILNGLKPAYLTGFWYYPEFIFITNEITLILPRVKKTGCFLCLGLRTGLCVLCDPLQGAFCRRPVIPVLRHINHRFVFRANAIVRRQGFWHAFCPQQ